MNRTDRLLAIVLELQGRGRARAEDLARQLEVSKRTIYRDVLALNEAGVPIVSAPGRGYSLMEGYFLPPLRFGAQEAVTLLLGAGVVAQALDSELAWAAESAARKIGAVLDRDTQAEVAFLRDNLKLVQTGSETAPHAHLRILRGAVAGRHTVEFEYRKRHADGAETRRAEPHGLYRLNAVWLLAAFDRERGDFRNFRLDQLDGLRLTGETFVRQPGFKLERDEAREGRDLTVRALFETRAAPDVRQRPSFFMTEQRDTPEGLLITLRVRTALDVLPWLLSWGGAVRVLEPPELCTRLREEAAVTLASHSEGC